MAKNLTILGDIRRDEHQKSLMELPDRDLCEMLRAHFASHTTLPGEKVLKDEVNQRLSFFNDMQASGRTVPPMTPEEKEDLARKYARTRIRETHLKEGNHYLDFRHFDPTALKRNIVTEVADTGGNPVFVDRVNVELQKNDDGNVYAIAEQSDGSYRMIGTLPENFLKNNPMIVERCSAELQVADYSNGNMKNISAQIVVDTDLMSGDVLDLDDDMLASLEQGSGLEQ